MGYFFGFMKEHEYAHENNSGNRRSRFSADGLHGGQ
jgi:hypothetical protein